MGNGKKMKTKMENGKGMLGFEPRSLSKMKEKEKDKEMNEGGDEINVTRIIVGNLDSFIDRYPYFMDKVNGWVKVSQPD